jgi:benzoylformate decarboxylase
MRALLRQLLDAQLSRRGFVGQLTALGVTAASAQALLASVAAAEDQAPQAADAAGREFEGDGAELLMEALLAANVRYVFHGCGGGMNAFLDPVVSRPAVKNFLCTNEGQGVAMAEGYHIASGGELGVAIMPKPGLPNAAGNIHNAMVNRSSMLLLTARGDARYEERRGNIELLDWQQAMDPFMKWSYRMDRVERVPEFTRRAIKVAQTPPGGPVFLQMTEDLFVTRSKGMIFPQDRFRVGGQVRAEPEIITRAARLLLEAKKPMLVPGLEVTKAGAQRDLVALAELLAIPVSQGLTAFADFPNQHPLHLGEYSRFLGYNRDCDLFVVIGTQIPDADHYMFTGPPPPRAKIVHVSLEPDVLAQWKETDIAILSDVGTAIRDITEAVRGLATKKRLQAIREGRYGEITAAIQSERAKRMERARGQWEKSPITYARLASELNAALDPDAIVVSEALFGVAQWFDYGIDRKMQIGPQPGEVLGWATGVALGAKLAQPDRQVVALSGDGAFMFQNALWSLSRYDAPVLVVIFNNRAYNMNRAFPWLMGGAQAKAQKDLITYLGDPDVDFATYARAFGVDGEVVASAEQLGPAIRRGIDSLRVGRPYLLDVNVERWGKGAELTWHPEISIAEMRRRQV